MNAPASHRLVAIAGGSGSGKGWLAGRLCDLLGGRASRLSLDDFYRDCSHLPPERRALVNFDEPDAIDWACVERVLRDLREGRDAELPRYDFATHSRLPWSERHIASPLVIVEGLWLLGPAPVSRFFDFTIYLDCPPALRFESRLARDRVERGRGAEEIRRQFEGTVAPMHALHVEPQRERADVVLVRPFGDEDVRRLGERLRALAATAASGAGRTAGSISPNAHPLPIP